MTAFEDSAIPLHQSEFACIDFVNSVFSDYLGSGHSTDRIGSSEWLDWFVDRHGLTPDSSSPAPLDRLVALRRDVRRVLDKWSTGIGLSARDVRLLDEHLRAAPLRMRLADTASGLEVWEEPLERSWDWVMASVATSAVELMRDGEPLRLKTCGNPDCSWVFYDETINRSKRFCSTTPCGSLIRVRRFRERA